MSCMGEIHTNSHTSVKTFPGATQRQRLISVIPEKVIENKFPGMADFPDFVSVEWVFPRHK